MKMKSIFLFAKKWKDWNSEKNPNLTSFLDFTTNIYSELKTLEWDILNPDRIINLEIKNERRTSNI